MTQIDEKALEKAEIYWNAAADEYNQWDTLDFDEKLALYEAAKAPHTITREELEEAVKATTYMEVSKFTLADMQAALATLGITVGGE